MSNNRLPADPSAAVQTEPLTNKLKDIRDWHQRMHDLWGAKQPAQKDAVDALDDAIRHLAGIAELTRDNLNLREELDRLRTPRPEGPYCCSTPCECGQGCGSDVTARETALLAPEASLVILGLECMSIQHGHDSAGKQRAEEAISLIKKLLESNRRPPVGEKPVSQRIEDEGIASNGIESDPFQEVACPQWPIERDSMHASDAMTEENPKRCPTCGALEEHWR